MSESDTKHCQICDSPDKRCFSHNADGNGG